MSFPIIEHEKGQYCFCNGTKVPYSSDLGRSLKTPVDDTIYYESIRFRSGVMVFFEDHMLRLYRSVHAKEAFDFDSEILFDQAMELIRDSGLEPSDGNLRIVLTRDKSVVHLSDAVYPDPQMFKEGIVTSTLAWERVEPQVKVFRGDYKKAVAACMLEPTPFGLPYEVLLRDFGGKITEGSRSNFFVLFDDTVYSPPESMILIGITRKYVMRALSEAGLLYKEQTFSIDELTAMRDNTSNRPEDVAVFVTSSPFDILPVRSIDGEKFLSADNLRLKAMSDAYSRITGQYVQSRMIPDEINHLIL